MTAIDARNPREIAPGVFLWDHWVADQITAYGWVCRCNVRQVCEDGTTAATQAQSHWRAVHALEDVRALCAASRAVLDALEGYLNEETGENLLMMVAAIGRMGLTLADLE